MTETIDCICKAVATWLTKVRFADAYIFGSLLHKGGIQFEPQRSDVDLVCIFPSSCNYLERYRTVIDSAIPTVSLNLELLQLLGRADATKPIVSVVPVTDLELQIGLHKDKSPQFFSHNNFLSVATGKHGTIGKEHVAPNAAIEGAFDSIRGAQRLRNSVLAMTPSGENRLSSYDDVDPIPKDLARNAAQTRWALKEGLPSDDRFDVNEGFLYMLQLLSARRQEAAEVDNLLCRILMRMNGRGQSSPLSASDLILMYEVLADDAFALINKEEDIIKEEVQITRKRNISSEVRKLAMIRAGYRCSFPGCSVPLGENGIGEIAHIHSPFPHGARFSSTLDEKDVYGLDNLIVLCPTHHRLIDTRPSDYPAYMLKTWNVTAEKVESHSEFSGDNYFTMLRMINTNVTGAEPGITGENNLCPSCDQKALKFSNYGIGPLGVNNAWYTCNHCGYKFQTIESSED